MPSDSTPSRPDPLGDAWAVLTAAVTPAPQGTGSGLGADAGSNVSDGEASTVRALPHLGEKINGYRLLESIGAGGMGAVFRAVDLGLDRLVALKILPPEQAVDPEVVRRYYQEGRAAAKLDHENIARVYAIGDDSRFHYIAFEYIEGLNIRQRVARDGPLAVGEAVDLTSQIAEALVHSSGREVVHRDIKPSNIIITPTGRAKLVDMGLARSFERRGEADLTQTGMTLGTFDYISPEQAHDPRDVDIRGDLYSLGCTLFYMLAARPPFPEGTVLQKLLQHREETPVDIRRLNPAVPEALATILARLLVKDRQRRYQTPEALIRDLARVPIRKLIPLPSNRVTPTWARHLVWSGPSVLFLLIFGFFLYWGDEPLPTLKSARSASALAPATAPPGAVATLPPDPGAASALGDGLGAARVGGSARSVDRNPNWELPRSGSGPLAAAREVAVGPGDDLARILAEAPPRSTIVLVERGPYYLRPAELIHLTHADLTIRGGDDTRPLIRLAVDPLGGAVAASGAPESSALVDIRGGRVTLEGLDFLLDPAAFEGPGANRRGPGGDPAAPREVAALAIEDAEVVIRRCSFRRVGSFGVAPGPNPGGAAGATRPVAIRLVGSGRVGGGGRATNDSPLTTLAVEASDFEGRQVALCTKGPVDVGLHDVGFGPTLADQAAIWAENRVPIGPTPVPAELRLDHVSGLLGAGPMFRFVGIPPHVVVRHSAFGPIPTAVADGVDPPTLVAVELPERLDWRGSNNLFARVAQYCRTIGPKAAAPIRSFAAWADDPNNVRESGSSSFDGVLWETVPATSLSLATSPDSLQSFRMILPRVVGTQPGARYGPLGLLNQPLHLGLPTAPNRTLPGPAPGGADRAPSPRLAPLSGTAPPEQSPGPAATSGASDAASLRDRPNLTPADDLLPIPMPVPNSVPGADPN